MRIIIGLGNPGTGYKGTRHNIGFEAIDKLCYDFKITTARHKRFRAHVGEGRISNTPVLLVQPMTYMNLSGEAVAAVLRFYKIPPSDMIVVYDDVNLAVGDIRVREKGSAGGQKGMISIIQHVGTDEFPRVRVGIGSKPPSWTLSDYVLSRFVREEWDDMITGVTKATDAIECILKEGTPAAMNVFNRKPKLPPLMQ